MENWQDNQLHQLMSEKEEQAIFNAVFNLAVQIGFTYASFRITTLLGNHQTNSTDFNNYPNEWNRCYQHKNYQTVDPLVFHCHRSVFPILWSPEVFQSTPTLWRDMQEHGLRQGCSQSVHDVRGIVSTLSLARNSVPITTDEFYSKAGQVLWLCNWLHSALADKLLPTPRLDNSYPLSPREAEIMKWTAEGKTASEIADILHLTTRTVGFHMSTIMRKFGVNNKASAVLCAAKSGLLF